MGKYNLTIYEKKILRVLIKNKGWMNPTEISKESGVGWNTVKKYLWAMEWRGWLDKTDNQWKARL